MNNNGDNKIFKILKFIILIFLTIYLASQVSFIFSPLVVFIQTVTLPVLLAGVLFYLTRPFMELMIHKWKIPKIFSIILIYISIILALTCIIMWVGPVLQKQVIEFSNHIPSIVTSIENYLRKLETSEGLISLPKGITAEDIIKHFEIIIKEHAFSIGENAFQLLGKITNSVVLLITVPFILFYMLKDGDKLQSKILSFLKTSHQDEGKKILDETNEQLKSFVQGQFIVALSVGIMLLIGYLVIGLDYAILLAFMAFSLNFVPYLGPIIGTSPALIVGLLVSPGMAIKVLIVIIIAQQVEGHIISPLVMGKKLNIHPLTIIILLLVAGKFLGMIGMVLALPSYVVIKVVVKNSIRLWKLKNSSIK